MPPMSMCSEIKDKRLLAWLQWRVAWVRPRDVCRKDSFAPSTTHDDNAKDNEARCNEARVSGPSSIHSPTPNTPDDANADTSSSFSCSESSRDGESPFPIGPNNNNKQQQQQTTDEQSNKQTNKTNKQTANNEQQTQATTN
jgi:hypothetical protein